MRQHKQEDVFEETTFINDPLYCDEDGRGFPVPKRVYANHIQGMSSEALARQLSRLDAVENQKGGDVYAARWLIARLARIDDAVLDLLLEHPSIFDTLVRNRTLESKSLRKIERGARAALSQEGRLTLPIIEPPLEALRTLQKEDGVSDEDRLRSACISRLKEIGRQGGGAPEVSSLLELMFGMGNLTAEDLILIIEVKGKIGWMEVQEIAPHPAANRAVWLKCLEKGKRTSALLEQIANVPEALKEPEILEAVVEDDDVRVFERVFSNGPAHIRGEMFRRLSKMSEKTAARIMREQPDMLKDLEPEDFEVLLGSERAPIRQEALLALRLLEKQQKTAGKQLKR